MSWAVTGLNVLTIMHLALWSQIGVLVRIYLDLFMSNRCTSQWGVCVLSKGYSHNTFGLLYPDLASNILGSFIMGFLVADSAPKAVAFLPPWHIWQNAKELHVGLRTGFCGSLTTFASWQLSVIQLLIGGKGYQGGQWDQFLVAQFGTGILCAVGAYILGTRFAGASKHLFRKDGTSAHKSTNQRDRKVHYKTNIVTAVTLTLLTALWIVFAILDSNARHAARRQQWFAILFAPFGAIFRWQLSNLNGSIKQLNWFPLGTLLANLLACCIDFGLQAALQKVHSPSYWLSLQFGAVRVGFSGALSTVSTFVQEVYNIDMARPFFWRSTVYSIGSISAASLLGVIIYGWSVWA